MAELQIETQMSEGVPEIRLYGELDSYSAPRVRQLIDSLVTQEQPILRINMTGLDYIDSTGLGVLVGALKRTTDLAGILVLIEPSPQVSRVLQVTGLDHMFKVQPDPSQTPASPSIASV
jgi:anti-sigma B factor antagonist